jgi:transcription antitermination protein NusB
MLNSRRVARELALKVLFQVDVGKQPLAEVLEGAQDQVRATVNGPIHQVVQEGQTALRQLARQRAGELSAQSTRQIRQMAEGSAGELRNLAEEAASLVRQATEDPTPESAERAGMSILRAAENTRATLEKLASRDSLFPEVLRDLAALGAKKAQQIEAAFHKHIRNAAQTSAFLLQLVHGATEHRKSIDERLAALSTGWSLDRQAAVDRNIMRVAAYEMLHVPDIPAGASINEAVELAKKYSTTESGRFVNGVLGALATQLEDKRDEPDI